MTSKPWITEGIRKSIKSKNSLFYQGNSEKYKYYRNKILTLTRISKKAYFHKYVEDNFANTKKTWEGINNRIMQKKKSIRLIPSLKCPGSNATISNADEIPSILNTLPLWGSYKLASNMQNSSISFTNYLSEINNPNSFAFNLVTPEEIELEILNVPMKKVYGLYSCPIRILRCARHLLSKPLSNIINKSVETSQTCKNNSCF